MKKTSIVLFLIFSLIFSLGSCKSDNTKDGQGAIVSNDQTVEVPTDGEKMFWDENGNLQKIVRYEKGVAVWIREYSSDGEYIRYTEYTPYGYFTEDKQGGDITVKISHYDADGSLIEATEYEYHENGGVSVETAYASDGSVKGIFKYDRDGVNTETHYYGLENGKYTLDEIAKFTYDEGGFPIKNSYYSSENLLISTIEYNESGNIKKATYYGSDGNISEYTLYTYSETDTVASVAYYDTYDNIVSLLVYDENGSKLKFINYSKSGIPSIIYDYGENGKLSKTSRYDENGLISYCEEFDENGTRIGCIFYNNDRTFLLCDGNFNAIEGVQYVTHANGGYIRYEYQSGIVRLESVFYNGVNPDALRSYDEHGLLYEETLYKNGSFDIKKTFSRDENGEIVSYTTYEANGTNLVYDPSGNVISGIRYTYYKDALNTVYEYENYITVKETVYLNGKIALISQYDENEVLIKESFYSSGKLSRVKEYDSNGVLRKDSVYNSRGKVSSVTRYDEKGNKI